MVIALHEGVAIGDDQAPIIHAAILCVRNRLPSFPEDNAMDAWRGDAVSRSMLVSRMLRFAVILDWRAVEIPRPLMRTQDDSLLVRLLSQAFEPVEDGGLQRDAVVVVAVIGFHVNFGDAGVAGFLERLKERVIVGNIAVGRFDDKDRARLQMSGPLDVIPLCSILFCFVEHAFGRCSGERVAMRRESFCARSGLSGRAADGPRFHAEIAAIPRIAGSCAVA